MTILQTIVAFLIALSILIVVHELGHYWVARLCNVKVLRFSLGMGKILYSRKYGPDQTEWAISILPLGGYVKLLDARNQDTENLTEEDRKREFTGKNVWCRLAIVAAGPIANFLLAISLLAGIYMYGMPEPLAKLRAVPENSIAWNAGLRGGEVITGLNGAPVQSWQDVRWKFIESMMQNKPVILDVLLPETGSDDKAISKTVSLAIKDHHIGELDAGFMDRFGLALARPPAVIVRLFADGPAAKAGLHISDRIHSVNGEAVIDSLAFVTKVQQSPGQSLDISVDRNGERVNVTVIPDIYEIKGQVIGRIQAEVPILPEMVHVRYNFLTSFGKGTIKAWDTTTLTLKMLGRMFTGQVSIKNITGPVAIADYAGQTARAGLIRYLHFIAFISISIGVMNLLPIPVLDGGLLLYYAVEAITGRKISERAGQLIQRAGVVILVLLLTIAIFNDISRLLN